ncbi:ABC transporter-related protein [candidate division TM7 genomosp. GTL1]|nr:ABC transporter-related protein [candidate division TM7 genomosp. GTL1]EDK72678.1 ABC transporter-related protein [candidate division TM7 genomosp. GTL1]
MADTPAITVENVSKDFRLPHERADSVKSLFVNPFRAKSRGSVETQHALKDISFQVKEGEFFGIVGRNGSGKSTLLKIIAGIYQPTKGSVSVRGRLVPFIELGVGFNPELTGRENVYLNGSLLGFSTKEIDRKYHAIVEFSELERFMDQRLKNYSSGMQVRLAFSVATILAESDVLLIDEVLAVGDADFQRKCFEYFRKLKKEKKTVVFVTHDMDAVRSYCDRAILIDNSEIISSGTSEEIAKEYTRMFMPEVFQEIQAAENAEKRKKAKKWGDGTIDIKKVTFSKKIIREEDDSIAISFEAEAKADFDMPVVAGVQIKDSGGIVICGTNSEILQTKPKLTPKKGQTMTFSWKVPHIFNDGRFTVEPSILRSGSADVCQWWDDAASFQVINEKRTPFLIAPKITLKVEGS